MPNRFMVRFEVLKSLNGNFDVLIALGIIPVQISNWLSIYKHYLKEFENHGKMQSYCNTSERFRCSESTVRRVVDWMESN